MSLFNLIIDSDRHKLVQHEILQTQFLSLTKDEEGKLGQVSTPVQGQVSYSPRLWRLAISIRHSRNRQI